MPIEIQIVTLRKGDNGKNKINGLNNSRKAKITLIKLRKRERITFFFIQMTSIKSYLPNVRKKNFKLNITDVTVIMDIFFTNFYSYSILYLFSAKL